MSHSYICPYQSAFTDHETSAIKLVSKKERELEEIRQWGKDLRDKLSLKKFQQLFGSDTETVSLHQTSSFHVTQQSGVVEQEDTKKRPSHYSICGDLSLGNDENQDPSQKYPSNSTTKVRRKRSSLSEKEFLKVAQYFEKTQEELKREESRKRRRLSLCINNEASLDQNHYKINSDTTEKSRSLTPFSFHTSSMPRVSLSEELKSEIGLTRSIKQENTCNTHEDEVGSSQIQRQQK